MWHQCLILISHLCPYVSHLYLTQMSHLCPLISHIYVTNVSFLYMFPNFSRKITKLMGPPWQLPFPATLHQARRRPKEKVLHMSYKCLTPMSHSCSYLSHKCLTIMSHLCPCFSHKYLTRVSFLYMSPNYIARWRSRLQSRRQSTSELEAGK